MKDDPSISGKKTVEESVVESSWMWVDGVFQDGLNIQTQMLPITVPKYWKSNMVIGLIPKN